MFTTCTLFNWYTPTPSLINNHSPSSFLAAALSSLPTVPIGIAQPFCSTDLARVPCSERPTLSHRTPPCSAFATPPSWLRVASSVVLLFLLLVCCNCENPNHVTHPTVHHKTPICAPHPYCQWFCCHGLGCLGLWRQPSSQHPSFPFQTPLVLPWTTTSPSFLPTMKLVAMLIVNATGGGSCINEIKSSIKVIVYFVWDTLCLLCVLL